MNKPYTFRGVELPPDLQESIDAFVNEGRPTGHFLQSVIDNDLKAAVGRADEHNLHILHVIVGYFYNKCPAGCWGFKGAAEGWIKKKQKEREGVKT